MKSKLYYDRYGLTFQHFLENSNNKAARYSHKGKTTDSLPHTISSVKH